MCFKTTKMLLFFSRRFRRDAETAVCASARRAQSAKRNALPARWTGRAFRTLAIAVMVLAVHSAQAQTIYRFRTLYSDTSTYNRLNSVAINNGGHVLWSGPTQEGPQIFLDSPLHNIAALDPLAATIIDSRLPRFGTSSKNAVWVASTGQIDRVTKQASPGSRYQEDRIYRYAPGSSVTPTIIGSTTFVEDGRAVSALTSPDVNDRGQAVFRRLNYQTGRWSLLYHDGSGSLSGTRDLLTDYALVNAPFISRSGKAVLTARQNAADPIEMYLYDPDTDMLSTLSTGINWANASLRDFSDDDVALVFAGSSATGSFYAVDMMGNATLLLTAGVSGVTRIELGQRNNRGQVLFADRTVSGTGGGAPSFGLSNLMLWDHGRLIRLTDNPLGVSIRAAAINDRGDVAFITQQYLYENGVYTGQRRLELIVGTAVPEPGALAMCVSSFGIGAMLWLRGRRRR
jgi:hypothetical protein